MVKSKKNPSRIWVHFLIFLKLNVQSIILSKFLQHEIENCYEAWAQKQSAKLQNMRVCTDKTGLSSITTCLTHLKSWMIGRSNDLEDVGRVASSFPTYLGKIEERLYWKGRIHQVHSCCFAAGFDVCSLFSTLESEIQLKESGIPLTIEIQNPGSPDKDWNPVTEIWIHNQILPWITLHAAKVVNYSSHSKLHSFHLIIN